MSVSAVIALARSSRTPRRTPDGPSTPRPDPMSHPPKECHGHDQVAPRDHRRRHPIMPAVNLDVTRREFLTLLVGCRTGGDDGAAPSDGGRAPQRLRG